jgi:hypothetical protein
MHRILVVLCLSLTLPVTARAQPAFTLRAAVLVDGQLALSGTAEGTENPTAAVVWRYLADLRLRSEPGVVVPADPGDPLKATLRGDILVHLQYTGQPDREVRVRELRLTRRTPDGDWSLDLDEVRRVAREAGLFEEVPLNLPRIEAVDPNNPPPPLRTEETDPLPVWLMILGGGGLGVLVAATLVLMAWLRRKARRREAQRAKA